MNFILPIYVWPISRLLSEDEEVPVLLALVALLQAALLRERSGGEKYPILPFTGEISYLCFTGSQKYF
jgi:hypothetical protein